MERFVTLAGDVSIFRAPDGATTLLKSDGRTITISSRYIALVDALRRGISETRAEYRPPADDRGMLLSLYESGFVGLSRHAPHCVPPINALSLPAAAHARLDSVLLMGVVAALSGLYLHLARQGGAVSRLPAASDPLAAVWIATAVAYLAAWIVGHELAHAGAARRLGMGGSQIRFFRGVLLAPRVSVAPSGRPLPFRHKAVLFLCGPAVDLTCLLAWFWAASHWPALQRSGLSTLAICGHLVLGSMNLFPYGRTDAANAIRAARDQLARIGESKASWLVRTWNVVRAICAVLLIAAIGYAVAHAAQAYLAGVMVP